MTTMQRAAMASLLATLALGGCTEAPPPTAPGPSADRSGETVPEAAPVASSGDRRALFGDLHIHSSWSFDAYSLGVKVTPQDAYRFARGGTIDHVSGGTIALDGPPLDFMALTEHAEYMGVSASLGAADTSLAAHPLVAELLSEDPAVSRAALGRFAASLSSGEAFEELLGDDVIQPTWTRLVELADAQYEPGTFTTFPGFEWTSMPDGENLHRNLIFRGARVPPRPYSSFDSVNPEDLWAWMDEVRAAGDDLIAIPHNGNASNGRMYPLVDWSGDPIDAAWAEARMRNEPVSEIMQIKGTSEAHPLLSDEDRWADFELFDRVLGFMQEPSKPKGSYVREALKDGLALQASEGFNPYAMGVIGSTDGHNSSMPFEEANYTGKIGIADHTAERRLLETPFDALPLDATGRWGAAGLAGVWAVANTREAIFDALRRRESFATSGTRIRPRVFAAWAMPEDAIDRPASDLAEHAVPMGAVLPAPGPDSGAPVFVLSALQDPSGAGLERLQIVKGWIDETGTHERVIDVACAEGDPEAGCRDVPTPAPEVCTIGDAGAPELRARWVDEDFSRDRHAFWYLRVLEVPTCRWSTYQARALGVPHPEGLPTTLQERAVTSAVFYTP
jgi:hypothetical protein